MATQTRTNRNSPITVGSVTVQPGQRENINLPVANLYTATSLHMPVQVVCGRRAGPVLFLSAAVHGDELNGVEIIRRLLRHRALRSIRGTLLAVPIVNVHGFIDQSRYLPDRRDLNRSFPGSAKGSIAARLAYRFMNEIVLKSDFGIDLHTGAIGRTNLPQVRADLTDARLEEMAMKFGVPVAVNTVPPEGSLRGCAAEQDIPVMVYEAGEALRFDELSVRAGVRGILNVMRSLDMLPRPKKGQSKRQTVIARSTRWVRAPTSGVVVSNASLGSRVHAGDTLALICDPLGDSEGKVLAPFEGIVIGSSCKPLAHEGDALFHLADFRSVGKAENLVEEFSANHEPGPESGVEPNLQET